MLNALFLALLCSVSTQQAEPPPQLEFDQTRAVFAVMGEGAVQDPESKFSDHNVYATALTLTLDASGPWSVHARCAARPPRVAIVVDGKQRPWEWLSTDGWGLTSVNLDSSWLGKTVTILVGFDAHWANLVELPLRQRIPIEVTARRAAYVPEPGLKPGFDHRIQPLEAAIAEVRSWPDAWPVILAEMLGNSGELLHLAKQFEPALAAVEEAIELRRQYAKSPYFLCDAMSERASILVDLDRRQEAIRALRETIGFGIAGGFRVVHSQHAKALLQIARLHGADGDADAEARTVDEAVSVVLRGSPLNQLTALVRAAEFWHGRRNVPRVQEILVHAEHALQAPLLAGVPSYGGPEAAEFCRLAIQVGDVTRIDTALAAVEFALARTRKFHEVDWAHLARVVVECAGVHPTGREIPIAEELVRRWRAYYRDQPTPDFGLLVAAAGRSYLIHDQPAAARRHLLDAVVALQAFPAWIDALDGARSGLAEACLRLGLVDEALEALGPISSRAAGTPRVRLLRALAEVSGSDGSNIEIESLVAELRNAGPITPRDHALVEVVARHAVDRAPIDVADRLVRVGEGLDASRAPGVSPMRVLRAGVHWRREAFEDAGRVLDATIADLRLVPRGSNLLAESLFVRGCLDAKGGDFDGAAKSFDAALDAALRDPLPSDLLTQGAPFAERSARIDRIADAWLAAALAAGKSSLAATEIARLSRARDVKGWFEGMSRNGLFANLGEPERRKFDELRTFERRVLTAESDAAADLESLRVERDRLETELVAALGTRWAFLPSADLATTISDRDALLVFDRIAKTPWSSGTWPGAIVVEPNPQEFVASVVRSGGRDAALVRLGDAAAIEDDVIAYLTELAGTPVLRAEDVRGRAVASVDTKRAIKPRMLFWPLLAPHLRDVKRIFVLPDGVLAGLPFGALRDERNKYLLESIAFITIDGTWQLESGSLARKDAREPSTLIVGGIDYSGLPQPSEALGSMRLAFESNGGGFEALPGTLEEARSIESIHRIRFKKPEACTVLLGAAADEASVLTAMVRARSLHLATHGYYARAGEPTAKDRGDPEVIATLMPGAAAGLVLAARSPSNADAILSADEVRWLAGSGWDLVVLSACHTSRGRVVPGEGFASLRRAFHLAGARSVVSACWAVPDADTKTLMETFYRGVWEKRLSHADALRAAQIALLAQKRKTGRPDGDPRSWAAWTISGVSGR
jgi:CHAT domain-containing protein/tetratricopeptide (TPR) repeat protein